MYVDVIMLNNYLHNLNMHVSYVAFKFRSDRVNEGGILERQESSSVSPLQA